MSRRGFLRLLVFGGLAGFLISRGASSRFAMPGGPEAVASSEQAVPAMFWRRLN